MPIVLVAASKNLALWGADVGLTKSLYALRVADDANQVIEEMNAEGYGGQTDWKLLKKQEVDGVEEATAIERLSKREKQVDPKLYPKIRGAEGIFKVKPENVENHIFIKKALASDTELKAVKVKPIDIAAYLIANATGWVDPTEAAEDA
ncbi:MAG TPA: hypothetical protein VFS04_05445 [Alphaproteobacteria bacterium]|nr:hypothetical protein [Alphaproteobacteria bacterium]